MITILSEVLAFEEDLAGYVTYIFRNIESKDTINYLRNCSKQLVNNIMKFVNE